MKNKLMVISILLVFSYASNSPHQLERNPEMNKIFTKDEIFGFSRIVDLFDSIIIESTEHHNINESYQLYFNKIDKSESFDSLRTRIGIASSNEIRLVIGHLKDKEIFGEIWKYSIGYDYETKDTLSVRLSLNVQGKYLKLLELLGESNDYLKDYVKSIQMVGDIGPSLIAIVMSNYYKQVDFQNDINRLVWAIHYITILSETEFKIE